MPQRCFRESQGRFTESQWNLGLPGGLRGDSEVRRSDGVSGLFQGSQEDFRGLSEYPSYLRMYPKVTKWPQGVSEEFNKAS